MDRAELPVQVFGTVEEGDQSSAPVYTLHSHRAYSGDPLRSSRRPRSSCVSYDTTWTVTSEGALWKDDCYIKETERDSLADTQVSFPLHEHFLQEQPKFRTDDGACEISLQQKEKSNTGHDILQHQYKTETYQPENDCASNLQNEYVTKIFQDLVVIQDCGEDRNVCEFGGSEKTSVCKITHDLLDEILWHCKKFLDEGNSLHPQVFDTLKHALIWIENRVHEVKQIWTNEDPGYSPPGWNLENTEILSRTNRNEAVETQKEAAAETQKEVAVETRKETTARRETLLDEIVCYLKQLLNYEEHFRPYVYSLLQHGLEIVLKERNACRVCASEMRSAMDNLTISLDMLRMLRIVCAQLLIRIGRAVDLQRGCGRHQREARKDCDRVTCCEEDLQNMTVRDWSSGFSNRRVHYSKSSTLSTGLEKDSVSCNDMQQFSRNIQGTEQLGSDRCTALDVFKTYATTKYHQTYEESLALISRDIELQNEALHPCGTYEKLTKKRIEHGVHDNSWQHDPAYTNEALQHDRSLEISSAQHPETVQKYNPVPLTQSYCTNQVFPKAHGLYEKSSEIVLAVSANINPAQQRIFEKILIELETLTTCGIVLPSSFGKVIGDITVLIFVDERMRSQLEKDTENLVLQILHFVEGALQILLEHRNLTENWM